MSGLTIKERKELRKQAKGNCEYYASRPDRHTCADLRSFQQSCPPCRARRLLAWEKRAKGDSTAKEFA